MQIVARIKNRTLLFSIKTYAKLKLMKIALNLAGIKDQTVEYNVKNARIDISEIVDEFHKLYYNNKLRTFDNTYWLGVRILKCPLDVWIYQEIIYRIKPDLVIETGTNHGGSALFLANMLEILDRGEVITVDIISQPNLPQHSRIEYYVGDSTSDVTVNFIKEKIYALEQELKRQPVVMVILDSNHTRDHVIKEMNIYSKLVSVGSYLIVEDSNINGHPIMPESGPGPMEAIVEFMKQNDQYVIDNDAEKFFLTFNPNGYLKRIG